MFYTNSTQINALAPASLAPQLRHRAKHRCGWRCDRRFFGAGDRAAPGIFTTTGVNGQAAAINQDGSLNSASNPAARGSVVSLYATGQGTGTANNVTVTIAGYNAPLQYAGAAPGYPGLMQINAQIPSGGLQPGIQTVLLSVNGAASQAGVTLSLY